jgi:butyrate kinase
MQKHKMILVINPGSTSTKVAVYHDQKEIDVRTLQHSKELLESCADINDQLGFRRDAVLTYLHEMAIAVSDLSAIAARGGVIGQLNCGAYLVDKALVQASRNSSAPHASNLASIIAYEIARDAGISAYIYDAVCGCGVTNDVFVLTGMPGIKKQFLTHVLNSRAVSIEQAALDNEELKNMTYVVAHMGGGITINLIHQGKIVDIVGDDEGAFSPERSGGVPCRTLVKLCYSGCYSEKQMQKKLKGEGGLLAYLGTNDIREVERMIAEGNTYAVLVYEAMAIQIAKDIGSLCPVVDGKVDKIILTGGLAYSNKFVDLIKKRVAFLAPISVMPGAYEMKALAWGVYRVLNGEEAVNTYDTPTAKT